MLTGSLESCRNDPAPPSLDVPQPGRPEPAPELSCVSNSAAPASMEQENRPAARTPPGLSRMATASSSDPSTPTGSAEYVLSECGDRYPVRARPYPSPPFRLLAPTG